MDAARESRIGGELCSGLPWLSPAEHEAPQGMLSRPEGCKYPRICAADRVCWMAKQREGEALRRHERFLKREATEAAPLEDEEVAA